MRSCAASGSGRSTPSPWPWPRSSCAASPSAEERPGGATCSPAGADPMAVAGTLVAMFASVSAHRYGFEFWGIRTGHLIDSQARMLHWAVTGRAAPTARDPAAGGHEAAHRAGAGWRHVARRGGTEPT